MNPFPGVFKYESSRHRDTGEPTERESRRKGDLLKVLHLVKGQRMVIEYQDGSGILRTSAVDGYDTYDDMLSVKTINSVYTFEKIK